MRYFIHLSFNGAPFSGWQVQSNAPSVQNTLEAALTTLLREPIKVTGCGRTDTGVHAKNYWAHFDSPKELSARAQMVCKLNAILPPQITILHIYNVPLEAHARFDATARTYRYFIRFGKEPFLSHSTAAPGTYAHNFHVDLEAMNRAAALLVGTHDFTSFSKLHSQTKTNECTVFQARWFYEKNALSLAPLLVFEVKANRFLRNMVRCMVGTLLKIGRGAQPVEWILQVLAAGSRSVAGESVPPQGLFLWDIEYNTLTFTE